MEKILIGKVVNTVGLKGEIRVYSYAENLDRFQRIPFLLIEEETFTIESVRLGKGTVTLKLEGISHLKEAENLRGKMVYFSAAYLEDLPDDTYYVKDLLGLEVVDDHNKFLGIIKDIITGGSQDLYEISNGGKSFLLPNVEEFILEINLGKKQIIVSPPEGLLDI